MSQRTALLLYTSQEDAQKIRERAALDHRNVSGYLLNILLRAVAFEETLDARLGKLGAGLAQRPAGCPPGPKTSMLLRCSVEQAQRIRAAARRRAINVSAYVRQTLWRSWENANRPTAHARGVLRDGAEFAQFGEQPRIRVPVEPSARDLNGPASEGGRE